MPPPFYDDYSIVLQKCKEKFAVFTRIADDSGVGAQINQTLQTKKKQTTQGSLFLFCIKATKKIFLGNCIKVSNSNGLFVLKRKTVL